jgi:hypothetical protein
MHGFSNPDDYLRELLDSAQCHPINTITCDFVVPLLKTEQDRFGDDCVLSYIIGACDSQQL